MPDTYDVIVLGLGAMGAAATYQLARRGARVLGIDRHAPPHEFGSTHGDTRITRIACGEGPEYAAFARRSHEIWRELEAATGVELLTQNGFLAISGRGRTGGQSRRGELPRRHRRRREVGRRALRAARHVGHPATLSRLQRRRGRRGLPRHRERLRAAGTVRRGPAAPRDHARGGSAAQRDSDILRAGRRLGHGEDGQGDVWGEGADRGGGRLAAVAAASRPWRRLSRCCARCSTGFAPAARPSMRSSRPIVSPSTSGSCRRGRRSTAFPPSAVSRKGSSSPPNSTTCRRRPTPSPARSTPRRSARCSRPMSDRSSRACRRSACGTRSASTPGSTARASSSTAIPTRPRHRRLALLGPRLQAFGGHRRAAGPDGAGRDAWRHLPVRLRLVSARPRTEGLRITVSAHAGWPARLRR